MSSCTNLTKCKGKHGSKIILNVYKFMHNSNDFRRRRSSIRHDNDWCCIYNNFHFTGDISAMGARQAPSTSTCPTGGREGKYFPKVIV